MAEITLTINGKEYRAPEEKTILQVVRDHGIDDIPTLCYEERLEPITACFLCVVEVEGARGLVPSCSTRVSPGMVVQTRTGSWKPAGAASNSSFPTIMQIV